MSAPHHSVFTGRMPFLPPNQQRQSTEGITDDTKPARHDAKLTRLVGQRSLLGGDDRLSRRAKRQRQLALERRRAACCEFIKPAERALTIEQVGGGMRPLDGKRVVHPVVTYWHGLCQHKASTQNSVLTTRKSPPKVAPTTLSTS